MSGGIFALIEVGREKEMREISDTEWATKKIREFTDRLEFVKEKGGDKDLLDLIDDIYDLRPSLYSDEDEK